MNSIIGKTKLRLEVNFLKLRCYSNSSQDWLSRQQRDPFVKEAQKLNYRARSCFKLLQIDSKYKLLKPGRFVLDLGAAPGSWCQVAAQKLMPSRLLTKEIEGLICSENNAKLADESRLKLNQASLIVGIDILAFDDIPGVICLSECDVTSEDAVLKLKRIIQVSGKRFDLVISDMAPNASGSKENDHLKIIYLCANALRMCETGLLSKGGDFLCKVWAGDTLERFEDILKDKFENVNQVKPKASRNESSELYFLCRNFRLKHSCRNITTWLTSLLTTQPVRLKKFNNVVIVEEKNYI